MILSARRMDLAVQWKSSDSLRWYLEPSPTDVQENALSTVLEHLAFSGAFAGSDYGVVRTGLSGLMLQVCEALADQGILQLHDDGESFQFSIEG
jgi:DNA gyrase/topoisomerase IV subunit B